MYWTSNGIYTKSNFTTYLPQLLKKYTSHVNHLYSNREIIWAHLICIECFFSNLHGSKSAGQNVTQIHQKNITYFQNVAVSCVFMISKNGSINKVKTPSVIHVIATHTKKKFFWARFWNFREGTFFWLFSKKHQTYNDFCQNGYHNSYVI